MGTMRLQHRPPLLASPREGDRVLIREDRNNYQKLILRDGAVAGIILQGGEAPPVLFIDNFLSI
jgi:hypothetical protein